MLVAWREHEERDALARDGRGVGSREVARVAARPLADVADGVVARAAKPRATRTSAARSSQAALGNVALRQPTLHVLNPSMGVSNSPRATATRQRRRGTCIVLCAHSRRARPLRGRCARFGCEVRMGLLDDAVALAARRGGDGRVLFVAMRSLGCERRWAARGQPQILVEKPARAARLASMYLAVPRRGRSSAPESQAVRVLRP